MELTKISAMNYCGTIFYGLIKCRPLCKPNPLCKNEKWILYDNVRGMQWLSSQDWSHQQIKPVLHSQKVI